MASTIIWLCAIAYWIFLISFCGWLTYRAIQRELFRIIFFARPYYILIWHYRIKQGSKFILLLPIVLLVLWFFGIYE
jgi:hypothetical protein